MINASSNDMELKQRLLFFVPLSFFSPLPLSWPYDYNLKTDLRINVSWQVFHYVNPNSCVFFWSPKVLIWWKKYHFSICRHFLISSFSSMTVFLVSNPSFDCTPLLTMCLEKVYTSLHGTNSLRTVNPGGVPKRGRLSVEVGGLLL